MRLAQCAVFAAVIAYGMGLGTAWAQRGVGEPTGVAQQAEKPEVVSLSGDLVEVVTGPCEHTTGPSLLGTHLLIKTQKKDKKTQKDETLNVHLGPAARVEFLVEGLSAGTTVSINGFRTEKMEKNHYVAQTVSYGDRTVRLRDENLRPVWAGGRGRGNAAPGAAAGFGRGRGRRGQGPGRGYGFQQGGRYGQQGGPRQGYGGGYGPRRGRGRGYGGGYGPGGPGPGWKCPYYRGQQGW